MKPIYTVIICTPQELSQTSYVHTGLFELEKLGFIKVLVKLDGKKHLGRYVINKSHKVETENRAYPKASFYKLIDESSGNEITFAFDLYDFDNQFSGYALNHCDYIFKRNFTNDFVARLPDHLAKKVYSLGLTFRVLSKNRHHQKLFYLGLMLSSINVSFKGDRFLFKRLYKTIKLQHQHWKSINLSLKIDSYQEFNNYFEPIIFFQTRCFQSEKEEDVKNIHQQRYRIIRLLQQKFPKQFQGGFISSAIANQKYTDALSNVPSEPEQYLNALKQAKIVIYTRGLANSPAWKMAEYLSQAKVIIAEKLTTDLPVPLIHGKELLYFETDSELIAAIYMVLNDVELANKLSTNARLYFETHVHPTQNIKRILEFMISKQNK